MLSSRQQSLLEYVRTHRSNLESYDRIAQKIGLSSRQSVQYNLESLVKKGYLYRNAYGDLEATVKPIDAFLRIPLLGLANCKSEISAEYSEYEGEKLTIPARMLELGRESDLYAVTALGDSMQPEIQNGDFVIVEKSSRYVNAKKIYLIYDNSDNECLLKRIVYDRKTDKVQALISTNASAYPPRIIDDHQVKIEGVVRAVIKKF